MYEPCSCTARWRTESLGWFVAQCANIELGLLVSSAERGDVDDETPIDGRCYSIVLLQYRLVLHRATSSIRSLLHLRARLVAVGCLNNKPRSLSSTRLPACHATLCLLCLVLPLLLLLLLLLPASNIQPRYRQRSVWVPITVDTAQRSVSYNASATHSSARDSFHISVAHVPPSFASHASPLVTYTRNLPHLSSPQP